MNELSHRRRNMLTGEYVLCSPHRAKRPWLGKQEEVQQQVKQIEYDEKCYLCPGNTRAGGSIKNPKYTSTYTFSNDFPAVQPPSSQNTVLPSSDMFRVEAVTGECKVVVFSPSHSKSIARMGVDEIENVVDIWIDEYKQLFAKEDIQNVQIFENKGDVMGCSNPHPHCQIWATSYIPEQQQKEITQLKKYTETKNGSCLLCDYTALELKEATRLVCQNSSFVALVPFWALWPYEVLILPLSHTSSLTSLSHLSHQKYDFADILSQITIRYDNLFTCSFPYSMGIHSDLADGCFHVHFYPPLLRDAKVKKFLVGFEMLGEAQRDITPESAAERLRGLEGIHYANT